MEDSAMSEPMCQVWVLNRGQDEPNKSGKPLPQVEAAELAAKLKRTPGVRTAWLDDGTPDKWQVVVIRKGSKRERDYGDKGPWERGEAEKILKRARHRDPQVARAWLEPR